MRLCIRVLIVLLLSVPVFSQTTSSSTPIVPQFIRYASVVPNADMVRVQKTIHFAIYQEKENDVPLWAEDQTVSVAANGNFSVLLGASGAGVPSAIFVAGEARWIAISVDGAEVGPRSLIVSVPYAMKAADADTLGGLPVSAFVTREETFASTSMGTTTTATSSKLSALAGSGVLGNLSANLAGIGGAGYVPLWMDGAGTLGNSHIFDNGKIGIGTSNPAFSLDVQNSDTSATGAQLLNVQTPSTNGARIFFNSLATNGRAYGIGSNFMTGLGEFGVYDYTAGAARLVINKSGFMGVGVVDPKYTLDIANADTTAAGSSLLQLTTPSRNGAKIVFNSTAANGRSYGFGSNFITGTGEFGIYDYNAGATRLVVTGTGNVGIGTSTPSAPLEVVGNVRISGSGNGILFPDGSKQTTAVVAGSGNPSGITSVATGTGLTGGGSTGIVTVSVDSTVARTNGANSFAGDQLVNGVVDATGGLSIGGSRFVYGANGNAFLGLAGNTTMTGSNNVAVGSGALVSNTSGIQNTATGPLTLVNNTIGSFNTANGVSALSRNTTGNSNTASGSGALTSNTTGNGNTASGVSALLFNTTGSYNTASGSSALQNNTLGDNNAASGNGALLSNTTGNLNSASGTSALASNTTGSNNTALGAFADVSTGDLTNATAIGAFSRVSQSNSIVLGGTGSYAANVGIGTPTPSAALEVVGGVKVSGAGNGITFSDGSTMTTAAPPPGAAVSTIALTTTSSSTSGVLTVGGQPFLHSFGSTTNTFVGGQAGGGFASLPAAYSNLTALGSKALFSNTSGSANTALGTSTLRFNTTGYSNTATGAEALFSNTTGYGNTANGASALTYNTIGNANTAIGAGTMNSNISGGGNTATGYQSLAYNTSGSNNVATGSSTLYSNTTGMDNIAIGVAAAHSNTTGWGNTAVGGSSLMTNTTGALNTAVGDWADVGSANLTNATAIGAYAKVAQSNSLVLGGTGGYAVKVGIGTSSPTFTLDVQGTGRFTAPVTFVAGQTFPGTGTITSINSGAGLTGGPITGTGTLSIATGGVANSMLANPSVNVVAGNGLSGGGVVYLGGTTSVSLDATKVPLLSASNAFAGDQTVNGNVNATGIVAGASFNIGTDMFAVGSHTNQNAFLGYAGNVTATGTANTAVGFNALQSNTTGYDNTALGVATLLSNTSGYGNTGVGFGTLWYNTTGNWNTVIGMDALLANVDGASNTAVGVSALTGNTSGGLNTAVGAAAMDSNKIGQGNTAVGVRALYSNVTGDNNTTVGYQADVSSYGLTNATAIGANSKVGQSNSLVLGGTGTNAVNVGIGTSAPAYTLDVQGTGRFTGPVTFASGQTFPGTGTVTSINSGPGLTGGPITSTGTLSIANAGITNAMLANSAVTIATGDGLAGGGVLSLGGSTMLSVDTSKVATMNTSNTFTAPQTITAAGTALTTNGDAKVTGNLTVTGTGGMPVYSASGAAQNAPHMVTGNVPVNGSVTVNFSSGAVFTSADSYSCTVSPNTSTTVAMSISNVNGTSTLITATGYNGQASFICVGN